VNLTLDDNLSLNPNRCHHPLITQLRRGQPVLFGIPFEQDWPKNWPKKLAKKIGPEQGQSSKKLRGAARDF